ncbi:hypothetical protein N657DRAFT_651383, partial [Parathielavia appendiculata]
VLLGLMARSVVVVRGGHTNSIGSKTSRSASHRVMVMSHLIKAAPFRGLCGFQYAIGRKERPSHPNQRAVCSGSHKLPSLGIFLATTAYRRMSDQPKGLKSRRLHSTARKQHLSAQKPES